MASIKRTVQSAFLEAGLTLEKEALNAFVTFVEDNNGGEDLVYNLLDASTKGIHTLPSASGLHRLQSKSRLRG
jgi:hypothetical protein